MTKNDFIYKLKVFVFCNIHSHGNSFKPLKCLIKHRPCKMWSCEYHYDLNNRYYDGCRIGDNNYEKL